MDPSPVCTYVVAPTMLVVSAEGGDGRVDLTTGETCQWSAQSREAWITVNPTAGVGSTQVSATAAANPTTNERTGSLAIADKIVTVAQPGREITPVCTYAISPEAAAYDASGGRGRVEVETAVDCAWAAVSSQRWLTIDNPGTVIGAGGVIYDVGKNPDPEGRTAELTIADHTFRVAQDADILACSYTVAPIEFTPCMESQELTVRIETPAACPWSVSSGADWLRLPFGSSGRGSSQVRARTEDNWDLPRFAQLFIRWPAATAGQNVRVSQAGCHYGVSRSSFSVPAGGATLTVDVLQQSDPISCGGPLQNACVWTAVPTVPWIAVTTSMPRKGDDRITFVVGPNPAGTERHGAILIGDRTITVVQAPA